MSRVPHLLIVMDGWGNAPADYPREKNAIALANTPYFDSLLNEWPNSRLKCSGRDVGLPDGVMGNSEVGHLNIGAGRIVWQDITRIDRAIEEDGLASNAALAGAVRRVMNSGARLHLMGLVSDGSVHSVDRHYIAILRLARSLGLPADRVFIHCFMDGRDCPPQSGKGYLESLTQTMAGENLGRVATVSGRYYAMDRDKRWERVKKAYDALIHGEGLKSNSPLEAIESYYAEDPRGDEFVIPRVIVDAAGQPTATIRSGDDVIFFNYRADRTRQLSHALMDAEFNGFDRGEPVKINLTTMTRYEKNLPADVAFGPNEPKRTLGELVEEKGMTQFRLAETEKYPHVTYFFSGGREKPFMGEDRHMPSSPKVPTYDLQPEMSAPAVTAELVRVIRSGQYDLIVCNYANGDMVGHTGVLEAAIKAVETVDYGLSQAIPALLDMGGAALISADHGNAEMMWNFDENCPHTQHTTNPTPVILVGEKFRHVKLRDDGRLGDLAPTLWTMMGQTPPEEMTGQSLIAG